MNKKFISLIMAAILAVSASAVCASAAEVEKEASKDGDTIFFDPGNWSGHMMCCYIWDVDAEGGTEYCTKNGWGSDNVWGRSNQIGVEEKDGKYESYKIDFSGRDGHKIYLIWHDKDTGAQTFDCLINSSASGLTCHRTGEILENPLDSKKTAEAIAFDGGTDLGPAKLVTSTGKVQGTVVTPDTDRPGVVANYVLKYLGQKDEVTNQELVTEESVADAISGFGTTADEVWAKYQEHEGEENYNAKEAKKLIKPTEATSDTDTSTDSSSGSGSGSSGSGSSSSSTTKTSTTATSTSTTGTTTDGGAADTASTGDTRGVVAFAAVLAAAAGTIVATRKKIED